jgi:photosystem II stability/assembly factor-like uncharacterized protein
MMRKTAICFPKEDRFYRIPFTTLLAVASGFLLILPSAAFCARWEPVGPSGGNFVSSVTNPTNANRITVVTTSPSPSNVYRSTNGGASWRKIGEIPTSYVSDVSAFDFSKLYAISGSRCYRSTDGGANWTYSSLPSDSGWAYHVCVDPTGSGNNVYAVGYMYNFSDGTYNMAFFKSTNSGRTWSARQFFTFESFYAYDMAISGSNPSVMYVAGYKRIGNDSYGLLLKSSDGGNSWTDISSSVNTSPRGYFYAVAIDPTDEERVYVGGYYYNFGPYYSVYCSQSTGSTGELSWRRVSIDSYAFSLGIDPTEPSNIYASGIKTVFISRDYGRSWVTYNNCIKGQGAHIEVAPATPSTVYVSSSNGLFKSLDSGRTWDFAHEGIKATRVPALAVAPSKPTTVLIEYEGCEMMGSYDSGNNWDYLGYFVICGNVCDILINPLDEDVVLALEGDG